MSTAGAVPGAPSPPEPSPLGSFPRPRPRSESRGPPGYGGEVPPNRGTAPDRRSTGTSRSGLAGKSPVCRALVIACQSADNSLTRSHQLDPRKGVGQRQPIGQVDQLQLRRNHAAQPEDHQRVELQLVERAGPRSPGPGERPVL